MGYQDRANWFDYLGEYMPEVIDFEPVSQRAGFRLSEAQEDIVRSSVTAFAKHWVCEIWGRDEANEGQYGYVGTASVPAQQFEDLVDRIEQTAQKLTLLLNQLGELDRSLLLEPHRQADDRGAGTRKGIDRRTGASPPYFEPELEDFWEYLSFRRYLSYFSEFRDRNEPYNNWYHQRYSEADERHDLEGLFRHIMAGLDRQNFPMGVAVPTDANPDYESPIIALLLEVHGQLGDFFEEAIRLGLLPWKQYNCRKMCRLASSNIDHFRQISDIFSHVGRGYRR